MGPKVAPPAPPANPLVKTLYDKFGKEYRERKLTVAKLERYEKIAKLKESIKEEYFPKDSDTPPEHTPGQFAHA